MNRDGDRLVYSTDQPYTQHDAPKKKQPHTAVQHTMPNDGVIRVMRERRKASSVTLIHGLEAQEIQAVARELKRRCGGGGSAKDGIITLQGDHRDTVVSYFEAQGRRCKKAGG